MRRAPQATPVTGPQWAVRWQSGWALPFTVWDQTRQRIVGTTRFLDLDYWSWPPSWPPAAPPRDRTAPRIPRPRRSAAPWLAACGYLSMRQCAWAMRAEIPISTRPLQP